MSAPDHPRPASPIIVGLDAIGEVFGRSRWTIARWIQDEGFLASKLPDGSWTTTYPLIDQWLLSRIEWEEEE